MSNVSRTMNWLRKRGSTCAVVEKWNQFAGKHGVRNDLFGIIDVLSLEPGRGILGIQCGPGGGHMQHKRKIVEEKTAETIEWLECGGLLEIWSWRKVKIKKGGKALRWEPRIEEITLRNFDIDTTT